MCTWIARSEYAFGWHVKEEPVLLVETSKAVQEQQRSTGHGNIQEKTASCGPLGGHEPGGTGTAAVYWVWERPVEAVEKLRPGLERCYPGGGRSMKESCSIQEVYISQGGFGSTDT